MCGTPHGHTLPSDLHYVACAFEQLGITSVEDAAAKAAALNIPFNASTEADVAASAGTLYNALTQLAEYCGH